ncbi:MAG: 4Fe-4S dicluster domain-containing protein [Chloroflexi bacterium]|nr:MAG: 4Fe-4S dicluster domain-containing protein [Chloroflexota bacterium]
MFKKLTEFLTNAVKGVDPLPPVYQVHTDGTRCVQCGVCVYNCPMDIPIRDYARQNQTMTDSRCIRCGLCVQRCPRGTLRFEPTEEPLNGNVIPLELVRRNGKQPATIQPVRHVAAPRRYLILGNGAAGISAAEEIRRRDPIGEITILTHEPYPAYSRPGIAYLILDQVSEKHLISRSREHYERLGLELVYGRATRIDPSARQVHLDDGRSLPYDRLLLAVGSRPARARMPGNDLDGVITFDTIDSARDLMRRARKAHAAVVIGGGITAMEMVEGLHHQGVHTHYLLRRDRIWSSVFNREESNMMAERITNMGIVLHFNEEIEEILGRKGKVVGVRLKSGRELKCQIVGVAIGVRPRLELTEGTGIETDRGILTDEYLQTSVPGIYAAGDCAQIYDRWTGQHKLDSLWPSAVASGRAAGANMAGARQPYVKGSPFNACQLFGVHVTAIGQLGASRDEEEDLNQIRFLSRGSSEVWTTEAGGAYVSAFDQQPGSSTRLIVREIDGEIRLVGALLMGNQALADPLRDLIEHEVPVDAILPEIQAGGETALVAVRRFWEAWRKRREPDSTDLREAIKV